MDKILLVRYGQHMDGILTAEGKESMFSVAQKILTVPNLGSCRVICADIPRALESATIIANALGISTPIPVPELYAAEEDGLSANLSPALSAIQTNSTNVTTLIAVISREYIDALPGQLLNKADLQMQPSNTLQRGKLMLLNLQTEEITIL